MHLILLRFWQKVPMALGKGSVVVVSVLSYTDDGT